IPHRHFSIAAVLAIIIGLVCSKALISIGMFTLVGIGLLNYNIAQNFKNWLRDIPSLLFLIFFLAYAVSGFWSADTAAWAERCRIKLPFIAVPFGFASVRPFRKNLVYILLFFYIAVITLATAIMLGNYLLHYQTYNALLMQGQPIPAPMNEHIRFSLEMAFAIICCCYLFMEKGIWQKRSQKAVLICIVLFLFICIHVFAVRSGIFTLYAALFGMILYFAFQKKHLLKSTVAVVMLAVVAITAANTIPSLKNRIGYFKYELDLIFKNEWKPGHSDAQRLASIRFGLEVAKENWLMGVGAGDIKTAMTEKYRQYFNEEEIAVMTPHNQFVYVGACLGVFGLLLFTIAFFYPLFIPAMHSNLLFVGFLITISLSLLTEHTFEIQIGTAFYMLFIMLFLNQRKLNSPAYA
ncbi:MAG: O-antigen ligase family protein, partial [Chitinophagales bacterium]